jgi:serine/threonine protein kinase
VKDEKNQNHLCLLNHYHMAEFIDNKHQETGRFSPMNDRVGQQFGNYRLLQLLGQGGFAEVYLAEHVHIRTRVAIKILYGKVTAQDVQAFTQEAQTIASLRHPHILRVLDFGFSGTLPFLVMDYAPGGNLRDLHPSGSTLPLPTAIKYVNQISDALTYAHGRKLIHRDIKPENMLIDADGTLLLSDFGIVTLVRSTASVKTLDTTGTVHYMAPEQIQGKPQPLSDLYSLAIVVYEWLCGQRPFQGESTVEIAMKQLSDPPLPLRSLQPSLPPLMEQVVLHALSKDPQRRFASVRAFATALEQAASAPQENARPVPVTNTNTQQLRAQAPQPMASEKASQSTAVRMPAVSAQAGTAQSRKQSYIILCQQVGEKHRGSSTYGALVVPAESDQIGREVYLLAESAWIKSGADRERLAAVSLVKAYSVNGQTLPAAVFTNLNENGYVVWRDARRPLKAPLFPGKATLVIDSTSVPLSPPSLIRDMAYVKLCEQVGAKHADSTLYGALVVPEEYVQLHKEIYLLDESQWITSPQDREAKAQAAFAKPYHVDNQVLGAAIFTNLSENGYVIWTNPKRPIITPLFPGRAMLVIDSATVVPSAPSATRDQAYAGLTRLVGAKLAAGSTHGALVIQISNEGLWKPVYLLSEAQWRMSPEERKKKAQAAFAKIYHVGDQEVVAAVFTGLSESRYIVWTDARPPAPVPIQPGRATLIQLSRQR